MNYPEKDCPDVREALKKGAQLLEKLDLDSQARLLEASLLLSAASGKERIKLLTAWDDELAAGDWDKYLGYIKRRLLGEPLQYITGKQDFMSLMFKVGPAVLIPRPETELLVNEAIKLQPKKAKILDLCTGSGAIAVSLAYYLTDSKVTAVDISAEALRIAEENARLHDVEGRIEFLCGDMFCPLGAQSKFNLITCNPPYISAAEYEKLSAEVKKEPRAALLGGTDGLDFYRLLGARARAFLEPQGVLLVEIGWQQGAQTEKIFKDNGFADVKVLQDWNGLDRIVTCTV